MNCEICKKKIIIFKKLESFNLLKCYNCDHIISNIKTSKKYYQTTYSDIYVSKKHKNWMNNPNNALFEIIYLFIKSTLLWKDTAKNIILKIKLDFVILHFIY